MDPAEEDDALLESDRYQGVHELFRYAREHGFDEEPPARIDAILMAAARQRVPEKKGALERFRRWMVTTLMQPAVAGAVAVAVIGGAAGVLYMKGKSKVAEPTVAGEPQASAPPASPDPHRPDLPLELPSAGAETTAGSTDDAELRERLKHLEAQQREQAQTVTEREARPKGAPGPGGGGGRRGGGGAGNIDNLDRFGDDRNDTTLDYEPDGRDTTKVVTTDSGGGRGAVTGVAKSGAGDATVGSAGSGTVAGGVTTKITGTVETPNHPSPDGTGATSDESKEQEEVLKNVGSTPETATVRTTKPPPSKRAQAANLLEQARTAAKKKDCPTVRTMAKRAKQLDAAYYRETFARDAALKDCL